MHVTSNLFTGITCYMFSNFEEECCHSNVKNTKYLQFNINLKDWTDGLWTNVCFHNIVKVLKKTKNTQV